MKNHHQLASSLALMADARKFYSDKISEETLLSIADGLHDRMSEFNFENIITKEKPLIVDLGSGESSHFYMMMDYYGSDGFTYVGVEHMYLNKDTVKFIKLMNERHSNFHPIQQSITDNIQAAIAEQVTRETADIILIEELAAGDGETPKTYALLNYVINSLAPSLLDQDGMMHIRATSIGQRDYIKQLLKNNEQFHFRENDDEQFIVVKNADLLNKLGKKFKA